MLQSTLNWLTVVNLGGFISFVRTVHSVHLNYAVDHMEEEIHGVHIGVH
jgi:hypothetical protein